MKTEISVTELVSILHGLTMALTCVSDLEYLESNSSEVRKELKKQVLLIDEKIKECQK